MNTQNIHRQTGFSLTEALVAFAVITGGLLAVASFQAGLFNNSAYNKARTEALGLAQQKIEELRHYPFAEKNNFIDENGDGVMDADGQYAGTAIAGNNADFVRSWNITTQDDAKRIEVNVSWTDAKGDTQFVSLASSLVYLSPRNGADQLVDMKPPVVASPTGRAEIGEGALEDYPKADLSLVSSTGADGLSTYQYQDDLFLVDSSNNIVLRLRDTCSSTTGICTDFVKISGTVYVDSKNVQDNTKLQASDIIVIASDAAHCQRWTESGSIESPPKTVNGDYEHFNYTCYFGGGWFGNIGFLTTAGLKQTDKLCLGDPTSLDAWADPAIALRRAYRGILKYTLDDGSVQYFSIGVKDAAEINGHDFVFTQLSADETLGSACVGPEAPMTRGDSAGGKLFAGTPVDFFCFNEDHDGDSLPDNLDAYDNLRLDADLSCPYDPTDPPVDSHLVSGTLDVMAEGAIDLGNVQVISSDGIPCEFVSPFSQAGGGYSARYACVVWDWGTGWSGHIEVRPNSTDIFCEAGTAEFIDIATDQAHDFDCVGMNTIRIGGSVIYGGSNTTPVRSMAIVNLFSGDRGTCRLSDSAYECALPYQGLSTDFALKLVTKSHACGSVDGVYTFNGWSKDSPHARDIIIAADAESCHLVISEP